MFAEGSKDPYARTRRDHPKDRRPAEGNPLSGLITGHTAASA